MKRYLHMSCRLPSVDSQPGSYSNIHLHSYGRYDCNLPSLVPYIHQYLQQKDFPF